MCCTMFLPFFLVGEHCDARCERNAVTRQVGGTRVDLVDVVDEVAHDQARVAARDGIVAVALARVVETRALPGVARDVEGRETGDRDRLVVPAAGEGPERCEDDVDDARVALRQSRTFVHVPVVVAELAGSPVSSYAGGPTRGLSLPKSRRFRP